MSHQFDQEATLDAPSFGHRDLDGGGTVIQQDGEYRVKTVNAGLAEANVRAGLWCLFRTIGSV